MEKIIWTFWTLYFLFYAPGQLKSGHEETFSAQGGSSAAASTSLQQTTDRQLSRLLYMSQVSLHWYCSLLLAEISWS